MKIVYEKNISDLNKKVVSKFMSNVILNPDSNVVFGSGSTMYNFCDTFYQLRKDFLNRFDNPIKNINYFDVTGNDYKKECLYYENKKTGEYGGKL